MDESRRLAQQDFDELIVDYLARPEADRAPMFGGFGLRLSGKFAAFVGSGGRLIVKLPAARAAAVVAAGGGEAVRVGGRPTREWVGVPHAALSSWPALIAEGCRYLAGPTPR